MCPKHRNSRRESAGWDRIDLRRCLFFVEMAWAGSVKLPALLISRLWFNSRMSSCQVDGPGATPGSRTNFLQAARQHAAGSPKPSLLRAARRQPAIFWLGSWQTSNASALQADSCGSVTHRLHQPSPAAKQGRRLPRRSSQRRRAYCSHAGFGSARHFHITAGRMRFRRAS